MNKMIIIWLLALCVPLFASAGTAQTSDLKTIQRQAELGDAKAQYLLGRMYESGNGVRESTVKAVEWYRRAAEQNSAQAQYGLGRMYAAGEGLRQDYTEALRWFRKAAAQSYPLAQNRLGVMHERGLGVAADCIEAYKWYTLAAGADVNVFGLANRDALACRMSAEQIAEGQRRAGVLRAENSAGLAGKSFGQHHAFFRLQPCCGGVSG